MHKFFFTTKRSKKLILVICSSFLFLIFLINFTSASIIFRDDAIFKGYKIQSILGNESVLFDSSLIGGGNVFRAIEKFSGNLTREECVLTNSTLDCIQYKNITYFQPNNLRYRDNKGLQQFISKVGNAFQYTIPLQPRLKWIKFGQETITIVGDTSYNSTNINATSETGFAHLNVSNSSIVLYMPFDENINSTFTYDYTNNSNDGTLIGQTFFNSSGVYGGAYTLDGLAPADGIRINNIDLSAKKTWSVSAWVNAQAPSLVYGAIFNQYTLQINKTGYLASSDNGGYKFSANRINYNNWNHVVAVCNTNTISYYINGTLDVSRAYNCGSTNNVSSIGEYSGYNFKGSIDEVMIWNIALNSTHVADIYNNQTQRFHGTGEMEFRNLNFLGNNTINISLKSCQRNMGSTLRARINTGAYQNFDSDCLIKDYNATGNLTNANLTVGFVGGNGTIANTFYTPLVIGNITLESKLVTTPNITFINPTTNTSSQFQNYILANLSFSGTPLDKGFIYLYNSTGNQINSTNSATSPLFINFMGLSYGTYYLNATANLTSGLQSQTETRTITLIQPSAVAFIYPNFNLTTPHIKLGEHLIFT